MPLRVLCDCVLLRFWYQKTCTILSAIMIWPITCLNASASLAGQLQPDGNATFYEMIGRPFLVYVYWQASTLC
jgi:hypothetical protein